MTLDKRKLRNELDEEKAELRRQVREKEQLFESFKKERGGLDVYFNQVIDSIPQIIPSTIVYSPKTEKRKAPVSAVMHTTDSHMGAMQEADEIEGLNTYNPEICRRRNIGFATTSLDYFQMMRHAYNVKELHWILTGDLISGDIHDELKITNAFPSPMQVAQAGKLHAEQGAMLAPHFDKIVIHFIAADNHARLTKKPQQAEAGMNSLNYLVGVLMKEYLARHSNIDFRLYPVSEKVVAVENTQYLCTHGHNIQGWMGVPWYGIERQVGRESTARLAHIMRAQTDKLVEMARKIGFHKLLHGHFHTYFNHPLFTASASVQGTTTLDHSKGRYCEPGQSAWLVHPKYSEFARTNFQLTRFDQQEVI